MIAITGFPPRCFTFLSCTAEKLLYRSIRCIDMLGVGMSLMIPMFRNMYADAESLIAKAVPKLLADTS